MQSEVERIASNSNHYSDFDRGLQKGIGGSGCGVFTPSSKERDLDITGYVGPCNFRMLEANAREWQGDSTVRDECSLNDK